MRATIVLLLSGLRLGAAKQCVPRGSRISASGSLADASSTTITQSTVTTDSTVTASMSAVESATATDSTADTEPTTIVYNSVTTTSIVDTTSYTDTASTGVMDSLTDAASTITTESTTESALSTADTTSTTDSALVTDAGYSTDSASTTDTTSSIAVESTADVASTESIGSSTDATSSTDAGSTTDATTSVIYSPSSTTESSTTTSSAAVVTQIIEAEVNGGFELGSASPWVITKTGTATGTVSNNGVQRSSSGAPAQSGNYLYYFSTYAGFANNVPSPSAGLVITVCEPVTYYAGARYAFSSWVASTCDYWSGDGNCDAGSITVSYSIGGESSSPQNVGIYAGYSQYPDTLSYNGLDPGVTIDACVILNVPADDNIYSYELLLDNIMVDAIVTG